MGFKFESLKLENSTKKMEGEPICDFLLAQSVRNLRNLTKIFFARFFSHGTAYFSSSGRKPGCKFEKDRKIGKKIVGGLLRISPIPNLVKRSPHPISKMPKLGRRFGRDCKLSAYIINILFNIFILSFLSKKLVKLFRYMSLMGRHTFSKGKFEFVRF